MRRTGPPATHSMAAFTVLARSLIEIEGKKKTLGDRKLWQGRLNTFHALVFLQEHTNNSPQQGGGVGGVTLQFCSSYILKSIV